MDHVEDLVKRFGLKSLELLLALPEVLSCGDMLVPITMCRVPLKSRSPRILLDFEAVSAVFGSRFGPPRHPRATRGAVPAVRSCLVGFDHRRIRSRRPQAKRCVRDVPQRRCILLDF